MRRNWRTGEVTVRILPMEKYDIRCLKIVSSMACVTTKEICELSTAFSGEGTAITAQGFLASVMVPTAVDK